MSEKSIELRCGECRRVVLFIKNKKQFDRLIKRLEKGELYVDIEEHEDYSEEDHLFYG